jgi:hypothetical protein
MVIVFIELFYTQSVKTVYTYTQTIVHSNISTAIVL